MRVDDEVLVVLIGRHAVGRRDHTLVELLAFADADLDLFCIGSHCGCKVDDLERGNLRDERLAALCLVQRFDDKLDSFTE